MNTEFYPPTDNPSLKIDTIKKYNLPDSDRDEGVEIGDADADEGDEEGEVVLEESEDIDDWDDIYEDMEDALHEESDEEGELVPASLCIVLRANFFSDFR